MLRYCHMIIICSSTLDIWEKISHDDLIKWKHVPRYWPFVRRIHQSPMNSPHKGQWHRALMPSFICTWINSWLNNRETGDLRRHHAHYDITVMIHHLTKTFITLFTEDVCVLIYMMIVFMYTNEWKYSYQETSKYKPTIVEYSDSNSIHTSNHRCYTSQDTPSIRCMRVVERDVSCIH